MLAATRDSLGYSIQIPSCMALSPYVMIWQRRIICFPCFKWNLLDDFLNPHACFILLYPASNIPPPFELWIFASAVLSWFALGTLLAINAIANFYFNSFIFVLLCCRCFYFFKTIINHRPLCWLFYGPLCIDREWHHENVWKGLLSLVVNALIPMILAFPFIC